LRAAFGQSFKDYINNNIRCSGDINVKGADFFGVAIPVPENKRGTKWKAVSGNGKCKADVFKCQKGLNKKEGESFEGRSFNLRAMIVNSSIKPPYSIPLVNNFSLQHPMITG